MKDPENGGCMKVNLAIGVLVLLGGVVAADEGM